MGLLVVLALDALDHHGGTGLLRALGLPAIMLSFYMSVKGRIGEVSFAAAALEIASLFVFARTP